VADDDFVPLPAGEYICRVLSGELFNAKKGTPGYKHTFHSLWRRRVAGSAAEKRDFNR
jgi:hypothetical protein